MYVCIEEKKRNKFTSEINSYAFLQTIIFSDIYIYIYIFFRLGKKLEWKKIILKLEATIILYTEERSNLVRADFCVFFYDETSDENFIRLTSLIALQITLTPNRS